MENNMRNKIKIKNIIVSVFCITLLSFIFLIFCSCFTKTNTPNNENSNNQISLKGSGSVEDPFQLSNADDLYFFAKTVNEDKITYYNQNVALMSDIDLNGNEWTPIGVEKDYWSKDIRPFSGNFNGNGFTISNFKIAKSVRYSGFFGYCEKNIISNLNLENVIIEINIKAPTKQIITAGILVGCANTYSDIINCNVAGQIVVENYSAAQYLGGLVGYASRVGLMENYSLIKNCSVNIRIKSINCTIPSVGGIVGWTSCYDIIDCNCKSILSCTSYPYFGGIIGNGDHYKIENCTNDEIKE